MPEQHASVESAITAGTKPADTSIKETLESLVISFVLAFLLRGFVLEPFIIPTGSMAPTLLGRHMRVVDVQSGYRYTMNPTHSAEDLGRPQEVVAPMSNFRNVIPGDTPVSAGDRILVLKFVYSFVEPRRWDVVVFKNPQFPRQNFIKRLIGLPGEKILLVDGNVYTSGKDREWGIARKSGTWRLWKVQEAVWQPIYHSAYVPLDYLSGHTSRWQVPWKPTGGQWKLNEEGLLDARHGYHVLDAAGGGLRFDWAFLDGGPGLYSYNGALFGSQGEEPVEDVRVGATVVAGGAGLGVKMTTTCRLDSPNSEVWRLVGEIAADGQARLTAEKPGTQEVRVLAGPAKIGGFAVGKPRRVELWYVDQEASLWVDGERALDWKFELPMAQVVGRPSPPSRPQETAVEVAGAAVSLYDVNVDRDIYYSSSNSAEMGKGGLVKRGSERLGEPMELQADQFFCLGDNSPASSDGRYWGKPDPWVSAEYFPDDPTLSGIVPRDLMVGRAFFVYWPAPYQFGSARVGVIPNFGAMRFIH